MVLAVVFELGVCHFLQVPVREQGVRCFMFIAIFVAGKTFASITFRSLQRRKTWRWNFRKDWPDIALKLKKKLKRRELRGKCNTVEPQYTDHSGTGGCSVYGKVQYW